MASRVDQIEFHVRKLAQATGVRVETTNDSSNNPPSSSQSPRSSSRFDPSVFSSASTVTSDLDIEALSKGLLDISKDLDHYLQTLLQKPDSVVTLKSDIAKLESELQEKNELLGNSVDMISKYEGQFRRVKTRQLRNVYHM